MVRHRSGYDGELVGATFLVSPFLNASRVDYHRCGCSENHRSTIYLVSRKENYDTRNWKIFALFKHSNSDYFLIPSYSKIRRYLFKRFLTLFFIPSYRIISKFIATLFQNQYSYACLPKWYRRTLRMAIAILHITYQKINIKLK